MKPLRSFLIVCVISMFASSNANAFGLGLAGVRFFFYTQHQAEKKAAEEFVGPPLSAMNPVLMTVDDWCSIIMIGL